MFHFLKYLVFTLLLLLFFNFFNSNKDVLVSLNFQLPFSDDLTSQPLYINYLVFGSFCMGILVAAFMGALRFHAVKEKKKELKESLKKADDTPEPVAVTELVRDQPTSSNDDELPSLAK